MNLADERTLRAKAVESKSSRSTSCRLDPVHTALLAGFLCLCIPPSFPFPKNLAVVGGGKIKSCCCHPRVSSTGRVFVKQITANLKQQTPTTNPPCVRCKPLQIEKLTHRSIHPSSIDSMVTESHLKQWATKQAQQTIQLHRMVWEKTTGKKSCAFQPRHELDAVLTICTVPCKHYETAPTAPTFTASFDNPNATNHLTEGRPGP